MYIVWQAGLFLCEVISSPVALIGRSGDETSHTDMSLHVKLGAGLPDQARPFYEKINFYVGG